MLLLELKHSENCVNGFMSRQLLHCHSRPNISQFKNLKMVQKRQLLDFEALKLCNVLSVFMKAKEVRYKLSKRGF